MHCADLGRAVLVLAARGALVRACNRSRLGEKLGGLCDASQPWNRARDSNRSKSGPRSVAPVLVGGIVVALVRWLGERAQQVIVDRGLME